METEPSGSAAAAASSCPHWVLLNSYGCRRDSIVAEAKDAVASCTSTGRWFRVSFLLAAPPASSSFCYGWVGSGWEGGDGDGEVAQPLRVVAAHGDSVLLEMSATRNRWQDRDSVSRVTSVTYDYFLYEAGSNGAGAPRLPSLSLLPGCYFSMLYERGEDDGGGDGCRSRRRRARKLLRCDTGLLRRGDGELVVVHLDVSHDDKSRDTAHTAELCVLRRGHEWELKQAVPIVHGEAIRRWQTDAAVPVGDRFLCFVDYLHGFLLCDMAAASLELRYVPLPLPPVEGPFFDGRPYMSYSRNMGAAGTGAVRFVRVEPRCCCGGHGRTTCARGSFFFTVTTWTMTLSTDEPMTWVKDGVLDCEELWALPAYEDLPQVMVEHPMVSSDDPDVVCFVVCERNYVKFSDRKEWIVDVDTRSRKLRSVVAYTAGGMPSNLVPAKLLYVE